MGKGTKVRALLLVIVFVGSTAATAWGQASRPSTLADLAKYTGADRERILYEGAKKEGKLIWYTSLVPSKEMAKVFESKYPGVTVEICRASGMELLNKASSEAKAKRYNADTIESTLGILMNLRDEQFFIPYSHRSKL
jgi:iron(III) transport system substrate-binding protein